MVPIYELWGLVFGCCNFVSVYGIAWNVSIVNYAKHEHVEEALKWFISMRCEGLFPDAATFVVVYGLAWNVFME